MPEGSLFLGRHSQQVWLHRCAQGVENSASAVQLMPSLPAEFLKQGQMLSLLRPLWLLASWEREIFHYLWSRCPGWWRADLNVHIINLGYRMPGIWLVTWLVPNSLHLCSLSYCPNLCETLLSLPIAAKYPLRVRPVLSSFLPWGSLQ